MTKPPELFADLPKPQRLSRSELQVKRDLARLFESPRAWSHALYPQKMRGYQSDPAEAIAQSVIHGLGRQFVLLFSRQSGKDETLAQVTAWLLNRYQRAGGNVVHVNPTLTPQGRSAMERLAARLDNPITAKAPAHVSESDGYVVRLGEASARFLSAAPGANPRGQTASLLLIANESQDIDPARWDAVFDPMGASTNATTVYAGTSWSTSGLLSRQRRALERMQEADGIKRVYLADWIRVAEDVPAYGERVRQRIAQLGDAHPLIQTEYCLVELDGAGGLFGPTRREQMQGVHHRLSRGERGKTYVILIDVAGEDETPSDAQMIDSGAKRDATAVTVVEVVSGTGQPVYRVVQRFAWTGRKHTDLHSQLVDLAANVWNARAVVIDATGVGAGLASFLASSLKSHRIHVEPFTFTSKSKSDLGWTFTSMIDAGRWKDYQDDGEATTREFWKQVDATQYELVPGPASAESKLMRWSVPTSRGHDDLILSAALVAVLELREIDLRPRIARG